MYQQILMGDTYMKNDNTLIQELGNILADMYAYAEENEKVTMIHVFGVKYAHQIKSNNISAAAIIKNTVLPNGTKMNASYQTEVQKGINLAKYVKLKDSSDKE